MKHWFLLWKELLHYSYTMQANTSSMKLLWKNSKDKRKFDQPGLKISVNLKIRKYQKSIQYPVKHPCWSNYYFNKKLCLYWQGSHRASDAWCTVFINSNQIYRSHCSLVFLILSKVSKYSHQKTHANFVREFSLGLFRDFWSKYLRKHLVCLNINSKY